MWTSIDSQEQLDALNASVCWEDCTVVEYLASDILADGLPSDVSRSGRLHPNLYVTIEPGNGGDELLELAFLHCDRIGSGGLESHQFHLSGRVDVLKRVEVSSYDDSTLLRCARLAFRLLDQTEYPAGRYGRAVFS